MTTRKEEDYQHPDQDGNRPAQRMTGGDETDNIDINDPCAPHKKQFGKCNVKPINTPQPREAEIKDDPNSIP